MKDSGRIGLATVAVVALTMVAATVGVRPHDTSAAATAGYVALDAPARLLDTRPGEPTFDGLFSGGGLRAAGTTLELPVAGRAGVPLAASSVALNPVEGGPLDRPRGWLERRRPPG